jgi:hypothetical protein
VTPPTRPSSGATAAVPPAARVDVPLERSPRRPARRDGDVGAVVLRIDGAWRPVRVSRDRWVTVEEAARILGVRTQVVRERSRAPGLVSVGVGRPGSPRRWRLTDLCPEVAVSARPRPSPAVAGPG